MRVISPLLIMKTRIIILSIIATMGLGFNPECSAQLSITTDTVLQTSLCAGGTVIIPYTVSGGSYNFGNVFTAQLSGDMDILCQFGTFSNPIDIGLTPYWNSGFIIATVPDSTILGSYRVRIIASNPPDTSSLSPNCIIILNLPPEFVFTIVPNDTICEEDTVTLSVVDPFSLYTFSWSTGETTQSIDVTQSGSYTVTVRDTFGCESTSDTMKVVVEICTGISFLPDRQAGNNNQNSVSIYPNPNTGQFTLILPASQLNSSFVLYDLPGKEIIRVDEIREPKIKISVNNIPNGIYIYNIVPAYRTGRNEHNIIGAGKLIINK